jgi:glycosyltransferase involved in cell wall biosynthesis
MRTLWLTRGVAINPASRYRYYQYLPFFERAGIEVVVRPLFDERYYADIRKRGGMGGVLAKARYASRKFFERIGHLKDVRDFDLVAVENQLFPYEQGLLERWLAGRGVPFLIEFDDAIYETRLHRKKLLATLPRATGVIVGNRELEKFARLATDRVRLVPSTIPVDDYPVHEHKNAAPLVVGWIGLPINLPNLKLIEHALREASLQVELVFKVISSEPYEIPGVRCEFVPWSQTGELDALAALDVGVMPLEDNPFNRGKCAFKLIQYMAAGGVGLASPVGMNRELIEDGRNGYLLETDAQWTDAVVRLAGDADLRGRLGRAGRETVERGYDVNVWGPKLVEMYQAAARGF